MLLDEIRMTQDALRYGYAVGKVGVLRSRVLDRAAYERVLDARTFEEQRRLLSDTIYGRYLERAATAEQVEAALETALDDAYSFLDDAALPDEVVRFFRLRYDFANLKAAAKARLLGVPVSELLVGHGTVPREAFERDLGELPEPLGTLSEVLPSTPLDPAPADVLGERAHEDRSAAEPVESQMLALDTAVDRAMFAELVRTAKKANSSFLVDLAEAAVDIANVRTLVRGRLLGMPSKALGALLIDGGRVSAARFLPLAALPTEDMPSALARIPELKRIATPDVIDPARLDATLDAITAAALRTGGLGKVGPEPVISYVLMREAEVAAVRVLLLGRLAGIDNETLRARLRAVA